MRELVYLSYSPFSERARWALDHHRLPYRRTHFQPLLGEPGMRLRTRNFKKPVTAPALYDGERWHLDSWSIAQHAEATGKGAPLFPPEHLEAITNYDVLSEKGLAAGRAIGLARVLESDEALLALVPKRLLRAMGRTLALATSRYGVERALRKYGARDEDDASHQATLRSVLDSIREGLRPSEAGPATLLGIFSYADITAAQVLQLVDPAPRGGFRIHPDSVGPYTRDDLRAEFADLLEWRDALYEAHRPAPVDPA